MAQACQALGVIRSSYYRHNRRPLEVPPQQLSESKPHPRALPTESRKEVREILNSERFCDKPPRQVYATLLDEDEVYLCDWRTMYRILEDNDEVKERRRKHQRRQYQKPELVATGVNQVWTWDITKLKGARTWEYFHLYVIIDIFSRYVVGWMLADRECKLLAKKLIQESCEKQGIEEGQLTLHSDNGPSMKSITVSQLLVVLGVTKSHSRPYVSNDNPFSEAQFKTVKYHPSFPERFEDEQVAWSFCREFFRWYNDEHYHTGINLLRPHDLHYGLAEEVLQKRQLVLDRAYKEHPERFVRGRPSVGEVPQAVWINPPKHKQQGEISEGNDVTEK